MHISQPSPTNPLATPEENRCAHKLIDLPFPRLLIVLMLCQAIDQFISGKDEVQMEAPT